MVTTPAKTITFEEYLTYNDRTDARYELVDGKLELMNLPSIRHFLIADFLDTTFNSEIKRYRSPHPNWNYYLLNSVKKS